MNTEIVVIILMSVLLLAQQVYYLRQIQKLIDKLMSGTYTTYVQNEVAKLEVNKAKDGFRIQLPQDEGLSQLEQLNMILPPPL